MCACLFVFVCVCEESWQLPMMTAIQLFHWVHSSSSQACVRLNVTHVLFQLFVYQLFFSLDRLRRFILHWWKIVLDVDTYHYHCSMCAFPISEWLFFCLFVFSRCCLDIYPSRKSYTHNNLQRWLLCIYIHTERNLKMCNKRCARLKHKYGASNAQLYLLVHRTSLCNI